MTLRAGLPSTDNLRFHQNFVLSFDSAKRNAKWVLEHITKDSSSGQGSRADVKFFEDAGVEPRFRSRLEDYRNSGYDRGHLVRASANCVLSCTPVSFIVGRLAVANSWFILRILVPAVAAFHVNTAPVQSQNQLQETSVCGGRHRLPITRAIKWHSRRPSA